MQVRLFLVELRITLMSESVNNSYFNPIVWINSFICIIVSNKYRIAFRGEEEIYRSDNSYRQRVFAVIPLVSNPTDRGLYLFVFFKIVRGFLIRSKLIMMPL